MSVTRTSKNVLETYTDKELECVRHVVHDKLVGNEFITNDALTTALLELRKKRVQEIYGVAVTKDVYDLIQECIDKRKEVQPKRALNFGKRAGDRLFEPSGAWWHKNGCHCSDDDCRNGVLRVEGWHTENCMCSTCQQGRAAMIIIGAVAIIILKLMGVG